MYILRFLIFVSLLLSISYSQGLTVLREERVYPQNIHTIYSVGGYSYVISDFGLHVISNEISGLLETSQNQINEWNKAIHYNYKFPFPSTTSISKGKNYLIVKSDDKILLFNTMNMNNIFLERIEDGYSSVSKVYAFGEDFIFLIGNSLTYAKYNNQINLYQISGNMTSGKFYVNYPYIIGGNALQIDFFKIDSNYNLTLFRRLTSGPFNGFHVENDMLIYYRYDPPSDNAIKINDLSQPDFPILKTIPQSSTFENLNFTNLNKNYYSIFSQYNSVYTIGGSFVAQLNNGFNLSLSDTNFYAFNKRIIYQFIMNTPAKIVLDWVNHYFKTNAVQFKGDFTTENNGKLFFYHNVDTILELRDSIELTGSYYVTDSLIYLKDGNKYRIYQLLGGGLHFVDSLEINSTNNKIQYLGEYILAFHPAIIHLYKKEGNKFKKVTSTIAFDNIVKGHKTGNSLFLLDTTSGVIKTDITSDGALIQKWKCGSSTNRINRMSIKDNYLLIFINYSNGNKDVQVYDISNYLVDPVFKGAVYLTGSDPNFEEMLLTQGAMFLVTRNSSQNIVRKYFFSQGNLIKKYDLDIDENYSDFSMSEGYKRLIIVNSGKITWYEDNELVTSVENSEQDFPTILYSLFQNYPNPFNPSTKISYSIAKRSRVSLKIYDIMGREIETLIDKEQEKGIYEINYTPKNLSSGIYFYTLNAENYRETKKFIFIK